MEEWRKVEHKGAKWLVSNLGNVRNPERVVRVVRLRGKDLQTFETIMPERPAATSKTKNGYLEVAVMQNGKRIKTAVHRLVGFAFVPGFVEGLSINHIDGNKLNNLAENLEWVSLARNTQHQWEIGLADLRGENQPTSKLTSKQVVYIRRLLAQGIPAHTLAVIAGVSNSAISLIGKGKRWPTVTAHKPVVVS